MFDRLKKYINESVGELKKVNWLTRQEVISLSIKVIIFSLLISLILGIFDALILNIFY